MTECDRRSGPYPYYGANGIQGWIDDFIFDEPLVLLAEDGGHFDDPDRGIAYRISGKTWVNNHAHVLKPMSKVDIGFLCRVLENYDIRPFISGTTRGKLTKANASQIRVPLPQLEERRRIAAILDKADALRQKRRLALQRLDSLSQSIFLDMFGDQAIRRYPIRTVAEIACRKPNAIRAGPFGSQLLHSEFVEEGIAVLGIDNAVQNEFCWANPRFITEHKYRELERYTVHPGDVLITIMGTCGRCAVVPEKTPVAINTKHLCCITTDTAKCLPEFLHAFILFHPIVLRRMSTESKGAIMSGLNMGIIKSLPIPVPPIREQQNFKERLIEVRALKEKAKGSLVQLEAVLTSAQHRAFRGEL